MSELLPPLSFVHLPSTQGSELAPTEDQVTPVITCAACSLPEDYC
jgi:hypothetical protein